MLLEDVYAKLKKQHLCSSAYQFSVDYLGKSPSYYSVLKARNEEPSIEAVVTLEFALKQKAALFGDYHPVLVRTKAELNRLGEQVGAQREIFARRILLNSM